MSNWRQIFAVETVTSEELFQAAIVYIESKIDMPQYKKSVYMSPSGKEIGYSKRDRDGSTTHFEITNIEHGDAPLIMVHLEVKKIIQGEPHKDYDRRSPIAPGSHYFKTKKKTLWKEFDNIQKLKKSIDIFFTAVELL